MATQNFRNLKLVGFSTFLPPLDAGHNRVKFKISSRFSSKKTPLLVIDGVENITHTLQAIQENRFVAKRAKILTSPRGDIIISIREFDIVSISDDTMGIDDLSTGELLLISLHEKDTAMTSKSCRIQTDASLVSECVAVSHTGANHEQFKLFVRKNNSTPVKVECTRHTSCGNTHHEAFSK